MSGSKIIEHEKNTFGFVRLYICLFGLFFIKGHFTVKKELEWTTRYKKPHYNARTAGNP